MDETQKLELLRERTFYSLQRFSDGDWEECAACVFETVHEHGWTYEFLVLAFLALLRSRGLDFTATYLEAQRGTYAAEPWLLTLAELAIGRKELGDVYTKLKRDAERCDACYFAGEHALARKDHNQALTLFQKAQSFESRDLSGTLAGMAVNHLLEAAIAEQSLELPEVLDEIPALLQSGRTNDAIAKAREFASNIDSEPFAPHLRALCLNMLGSQLLAAGQSRPAEPLLAEAVRRYRASAGTAPSQLASSIHNWGQAKFALGDLLDAEALYREELGFEWEVEGSQNIIDAALALTTILQKTGRLDEARSTAMDLAHRFHRLSHATFNQVPTVAVQYARGALQLCEAVLEPTAPELAPLLQTLGRTLRAMGHLEEAQTYLERALAAVKSDDVAPRTAILNSLGANANDLGDSESAEQFFRDVIALGEGRAEALLASTYVNLSRVVSKRHEYNDAERLLELALERIEQHPHERMLSPREVYAQLLRLLLRAGRFARAGAAGERALALPASELESASIESDLQGLTGKALHMSGRYPQAIAHLEQALKLCHGDRTLDTLHLRLDLALALTRVGRFAAADDLARQAERDSGEWSGDPVTRVSILNQLAVLREEVHDFVSAERMYRQAITLLEQANSDSGVLATLYNNFGLLKQSMGDPRTAHELFDRALTLRRALEPGSPSLARMLYNIGNQYEQGASSGELDAPTAEILYEMADRNYTEALGILRQSGEQDTLSYVLNTLALALVHQLRADYTEAEPLYVEALALAERLGASAGTHVVRANLHLAKLYAATGRAQLALALFARTQASESRFLGEVFSLTSEATRLDYVERLRENFWSVLTLACQNRGDPDVARLAFDCVTRNKALVVDAGAMQRRLEAASADPHVAEFVAEARAMRTASPPDSEPDSIEARGARLGEIEVELARRVFADVRDRLHATVEDLLAALPRDGALIEVVWYRTMHFDRLPAAGDHRFGSARYLALIAQHTNPPITAVDLGDAQQIDALIEYWRECVLPQANRFPDVAELRRANLALRQAIFDPLAAAVGSLRRIYYSPDATLNLVPLEALEFEPGEFLLDSWEITYLSSARDLLRAADPRTTDPSPPVVIADPDYGVGEGGFERLYGTRKEGEEIARLLMTSPWLGADASKSRLLSVRSPSVLHIATHGFFLQMDEAPEISDPLQRSGLALAGANASREGLLTAADVAILALGATELVVLSACETGIGVLRPGEGVFGLRRSFVLAGARTLVMSLWEVPDEITMELMRRFYRYLADGCRRSEALRHARLDVRGTHAHPFFWGAFICQGDCAPLKL